MHVGPSMASQHCAPVEEPSTEDGSNTSDSGAFSTIFSCPSSFNTEEENLKRGHQAITCSVDAPSNALHIDQDHVEPLRQDEESEREQVSDQDKAAMVCRHWKS